MCYRDIYAALLKPAAGCDTRHTLSTDNLSQSKDYKKGKNGAGNRSRTYDLRITNALLYQLSYTGVRHISAAKYTKMRLRAQVRLTVEAEPLV